MQYTIFLMPSFLIKFDVKYFMLNCHKVKLRNLMKPTQPIENIEQKMTSHQSPISQVSLNSSFKLFSKRGKLGMCHNPVTFLLSKCLIIFKQKINIQT